MFLSSLLNSLKAAEGAAGIYVLGSQGPLAGFLPPVGFYIRHDDYFYHGRADIAPLGGKINLDVKARVFLDFTTLTFVTPFQLMKASYAFAVVMPLGKVSIKANIFNVYKKQTDSGYADMIVYPVMLGWHATNFHVLTSLGIFLPTGHYGKRRLANIGKNHYAADPGVGFTWQNAKYGLEISNWTGYTINFENKKTHYKTGGEFHTELFLGKSMGKNLQIGLVSYLYHQMTGDSGKGALLGSFKGRVIGMGPLILYNFKLCNTPVSVNARYYKEFDVLHRLKGDSVFITFAFPLFSS
ncbi:MAG: SphA family protein [Candidatus Rhabdochlamydia sp.]